LAGRRQAALLPQHIPAVDRRDQQQPIEEVTLPERFTQRSRLRPLRRGDRGGCRRRRPSDAGARAVRARAAPGATRRPPAGARAARAERGARRGDRDGGTRAFRARVKCLVAVRSSERRKSVAEKVEGRSPNERRPSDGVGTPAAFPVAGIMSNRHANRAPWRIAFVIPQTPDFNDENEPVPASTLRLDVDAGNLGSSLWARMGKGFPSRLYSTTISPTASGCCLIRMG